MLDLEEAVLVTLDINNIYKMVYLLLKRKEFLTIEDPLICNLIYRPTREPLVTMGVEAPLLLDQTRL